MELLEQQKKEVENLKTATSQEVDLKNLMEAMMQAITYMYMTNEGPSMKITGTKTVWK